MKIKGHIHGIRLANDEGKQQAWYFKLAEDCQLGKAGEVVLVSKAEKEGNEWKVEK